MQVNPLAPLPVGPILPTSSDNEDGDDEDHKMNVNKDNNNEVKADHEDDNNNGALPPPPPIAPVPLLLPAPIVVAILASFASALGQFDVLIATTNAVPLTKVHCCLFQQVQCDVVIMAFLATKQRVHLMY